MHEEVAATTTVAARLTPLAPLRNRNFRLLWSGLVVSNAGSWVQFTALGYLMDELTRAPVWLGVLGLVQAVPRLGFAFLGGVLADRIDRRRVMLVANLVAMGSSLLLGTLTALKLVGVWHLLVIAAFNSLVASFDMPARQALTPSLVGEGEVLQAVSLNSLAFNGSGVVGPAVAGVVISLIGTHGAFFLNSVSYLAVIGALLALRLPADVPRLGASFRQDAREGLALLGRQRVLLVLMGLVAVISFFGRPYIRLMPAVAREILAVGPQGLGVLQAAPGIGTFLAVLVTGWSAGRMARGALMLSAAFVMGVAVTLFALSTSFALSVALLVGVGMSQSVAMAAGNTLVQTTVLPGQRGRAMGLFGSVAFGMMALGTLPAGFAAGVLGLSWALALGGIVLMTAVLALTLARPGLRRL